MLQGESMLNDATALWIYRAAVLAAAGSFSLVADAQDFRYVADEDVYVCPAGEKLTYSFTTQDKGMVLRRYRR